MTTKNNGVIINLAQKNGAKFSRTFHTFNLWGEIFKKEDMTLKNNFRILLAKQRKKVSDVSEATGIAKSTLTALYYERTKRPDIERLTKVADYLGVTVGELLTPEQ